MKEDRQRKRVVVVGAGISGLTAVKHCLEEGLDPLCVELRSDLGGLWNYTPTVVRGRSSVMSSTVANTCKVGTQRACLHAASFIKLPTIIGRKL